MNLQTSIAGVTLQNPMFNASGPLCTTKEDLDNLGKSDASVILVKSATLEPRDGNPEPRYADFEGGSINSIGLANLGYKAYADMIPQLNVHNKPIFASVSGLKLADNIEIIENFSNIEALEAIELNLSCPNVIGKPQIGYDMDQTREVLQEVAKVCKKPLGVKLPPYFDFAHFQEVANILNRSSIQFVTCINSLGNGLAIDPKTETVLIKPKGGFGGVGGRIIKPFGLSNVRKFRELLAPQINVIGVGGIFTGLDAFEYILAGADAVQIGTTLQREGPGCFTRILSELQNVMKEKGYDSLDDFKNKLKVVD